MSPPLPPRTKEPGTDDLFRTCLEAWAEGDLDKAELGDRAKIEPRLGRRIEILRNLDALSETLAKEGDADLDLLPPEEELQHLDRFEALAPIGRGGLSRVYRAFDPELSREVALKVFDPRLGGSESGRSWTLNEGRSLARLNHPGVVRVFEVGESEGLTYIAMELVEGPSLYDVLDAMRAPTAATSGDALAAARALSSIAARVRVVRGIADALAYGHEQGVVHRDIKPANVLVGADLQPKLIDFGLAHVTESESLTDVTQRLVGTPGYIAPEQVDAGRTGKSPHSDQFSLGVLLYELLTGKNPFERRTRSETLAAISRATPPRPRSLNTEIPPALEHVCLHCLEVSPQRRYPSLEALRNDLDAFLEHRATSLAASPGMVARLWVRRNRAHLAVAAGALILLCIALVLTRHLQVEERLERIEDELDTLHAEALTLQTPDDLRDALKALERQSIQLDQLAASPLASGVPGLRARGRRTLDRLSASLARVIGREYAEADSMEDRALRAVSRAKTYARWASVLETEAELQDEAWLTDEYRKRGEVGLPDVPPGERLRLYRQASPFVDPILLELPSGSELGPGFYLMQRLDAAVRILDERNFEIEFAAPFRKIRFTPRDESDPGAYVRIGGSSVEYVYYKNDRKEIELAAFEVMRRPVTWGEIARTLGPEAGRHAFVGPDPPDEAPAQVSWEVADEYARAHGARLPRLVELLRALERDELEVPAGLTGEHTADPARQFMNRLFIRYQTLGEKRPLYDHAGFSLQSRPGVHSCFRLARTVDDE